MNSLQQLLAPRTLVKREVVHLQQPLAPVDARELRGRHEFLALVEPHFDLVAYEVGLRAYRGAADFHVRAHPGCAVGAGEEGAVGGGGGGGGEAVDRGCFDGVGKWKHGHEGGEGEGGEECDVHS